MQINELELIKSCQILFGGQLDVSRDFLEYIQLSGLKSAYRKKVRETHPDSAAREGEVVQRQRADEFRTVQQAYENLTNYLVARDKGRPVFSFPGGVQEKNDLRRKSPAGATSVPADHETGRHRRKGGNYSFGDSGRKCEKQKTINVASSRPSSSSLYKGALPKRRLLFGHFLYYSGLINWRTIVKALAWQKNNRPRLGELGKRVGWLSDTNVEQVIRNRKGMESFGQAAQQLGLLDAKQLDALVLQQNRLQRKFGEFFVVHKIFTQEQVESLARQCRRHNDQFPI